MLSRTVFRTKVVAYSFGAMRPQPTDETKLDLTALYPLNVTVHMVNSDNLAQAFVFRHVLPAAFGYVSS